MNRMTTMMRHMERYILDYLTYKHEATKSDIQLYLWRTHRHLEKPKVSTTLKHMVANKKAVREIKLTTGGAKRAVYKLATRAADGTLAGAEGE